MRAEEGEEVDLENALAGLILCVCTYYRGDCCTTSSKPWCFALFTICINPHVSSRHAGLSFFSVFPVSWRSQPCKGVGTEETERGNRVYVRETFRGLQDLVMKQEVFLVKVFLLQGLQACFLLSDTAVGTGEQHLAHRAGTWTPGYWSFVLKATF